MVNILNGIKVLEFSSNIMVPLMGKILGDYGAEVIKIESSTHPDVFRGAAPFPDSKVGINKSASFSHVNSSKYSMLLNLNHPDAAEIIHQLVQWSDIVIEGFTPGILAKWGLSYEEVSRIKPEIIMVSASMQGQTGPLSKQRGIGSLAQATIGFNSLTGWPGQPPNTFLTPYPDFITPCYALSAILAGIDYKRRTGTGQYIDISQMTAGLQFLIPAILDYTANGRAQSANGNSATYAVPHNVYRCKGNDKWCTIAVFSESEWQALCTVIGNKAITGSPKFSSFHNRKKNEAELDKIIEQWTCQYSPVEVKNRLQAAGVTSDVVQDGQDLSQDINFKSRDFFQSIDHPEMGRCTYFRAPFQLSDNPCEMRRAPLLGEHTEYVMTKILGTPDSEFIELLNKGVFE